MRMRASTRVCGYTHTEAISDIPYINVFIDVFVVKLWTFAFNLETMANNTAIPYTVTIEIEKDDEHLIANVEKHLKEN